MSDAWTTTTIGECLDAAFSGEWGAEPKQANALVFRATDIDDDGRIVGGGAPRRLPIGKLTAKQLRDGDILLEGSGGGPGKPVGRVAYFSGDAQADPAVCSNFFKTLRPTREKVAPRFLVRKLWWFHKQPRILALQQQTTGIINLKFEEYLASQISIPRSVSEQGKIAQTLDILDTAIHETDAIIAKLKAVKQGLLHDLLTRGIDANGELRPAQAEAPHFYKQSPLGWIPQEWSVASVGTLLSEPPRNGLYKPPHLIGRGALLVGQTAFTDHGSVKFELARRAQVGQSELSVFGLQAGDLLVSRVFATLDGVGQPVIVPEMPEASVYESNMMRMRPRQGVVTSAMLFNLLKLPSSRAAVRSRAFLSNQASINRHGICSVELALPSWEEQLAIDARVMSLTDRLKHELEALTKWRSEKTGLMDDLLTGRVRVTPLLAGAEREKECV